MLSLLYFLNFLKVLTVVWRGIFIAQFQRNRGRGYHNLLRQVSYSRLSYTSGLNCECCSADRDFAYHTRETPSQMVDDGRCRLLSRPRFYRVRSDKPQRLGSREPNGISHWPRAVHHRTHPVTVRVSGLGETGFKSMSSSGLASQVMATHVSRAAHWTSAAALSTRAPCCIMRDAGWACGGAKRCRRGAAACQAGPCNPAGTARGARRSSRSTSRWPPPSRSASPPRTKSPRHVMPRQSRRARAARHGQGGPALGTVTSPAPQLGAACSSGYTRK